MVQYIREGPGGISGRDPGGQEVFVHGDHTDTNPCFLCKLAGDLLLNTETVPFHLGRPEGYSIPGAHNAEIERHETQHDKKEEYRRFHSFLILPYPVMCVKLMINPFSAIFPILIISFIEQKRNKNRNG